VLIELGAPVCCSDGPVGEVADVVIDPLHRRLTHLVVQPHKRHALARLVPMEIARPEAERIVLDCTTEDVRGMEHVQEFACILFGEPLLQEPGWDVGIEDVLVPPYYEVPGFDVPVRNLFALTYDRIPEGAVELRRASEVFSSDDHRLGHVAGFVIGPDDRITQLVLERGHVWGRHLAAVPIAAVERVETDSVRLSLRRNEVAARTARPSPFGIRRHLHRGRTGARPGRFAQS
jgi:sporulation protein YlmC with PRC-barrel domain